MAQKWARWFPLYGDDLLSSRRFQSLTPERRWYYIALLLAQWDSETCSLPDDPGELAVLSGAGNSWPRHAPHILPFFRASDSSLKNERCLLEWAKARDRYEAFQRRTAAATEARRSSSRQRNDHATSLQPQPQSQKEKETYLFPPPAKAAQKPTPKTLLPDDFQPSERNVEYARENGINLGAEFLKFVNHAKANARRQADWQASLRLWLGNQVSPTPFRRA